MKQRLGALLCLALGTVLVTTGLMGNDVTVGSPAPTCMPTQQAVGVSPAQNCPTGTIAITEETTGVAPSVRHAAARAATPTPPAAGWTVLVTSSCVDPNTGSATSQTVTVPNNGTATSGPLFVYTNVTGTTQCTYTLSQTNTPSGFTAAFAPSSPVSIAFGGGQTNSGVKVTLTNSFRIAVTSTPPTTAPVTTTLPASTPVTSTVSAPVSTSTVAVSPVASSSSGSVIANTGPREQLRASVWIGIALLVLGVVLLLGGLPRRRARHRG